MYRLGLTRSRIAVLVGAPASTVGYHLTVARGLDAGLANEHEAAKVGKKGTPVTQRGLKSMTKLIDFVKVEGRYPTYSSTSTEERTLAMWLQRRRRNAAAGTLAPAFREGLQALSGWEANTRAWSDESRWQERLTALIEYRAKGEDWPRHKKTATAEEHVLGVWLHTQRFKNARCALHKAKRTALDTALPGWQEGRIRGRKRSSRD